MERFSQLMPGDIIRYKGDDFLGSLEGEAPAIGELGQVIAVNISLHNSKPSVSALIDFSGTHRVLFIEALELVIAA